MEKIEIARGYLVLHGETGVQMWRNGDSGGVDV